MDEATDANDHISVEDVLRLAKMLHQRETEASLGAEHIQKAIQN